MDAVAVGTAAVDTVTVNTEAADTVAVNTVAVDAVAQELMISLYYLCDSVFGACLH